MVGMISPSRAVGRKCGGFHGLGDEREGVGDVGELGLGQVVELGAANLQAVNSCISPDFQLPNVLSRTC